jgi:hypothetical protein
VRETPVVLDGNWRPVTACAEMASHWHAETGRRSGRVSPCDETRFSVFFEPLPAQFAAGLKFQERASEFLYLGNIRSQMTSSTTIPAFSFVQFK